MNRYKCVNLLLWVVVCIYLAFPLMNNSTLYAAVLATVDFNYINDLIGDRATGMGGAYTAISDDPSGAYYNPAGLVFAFENQISLSVNSYKKKDIKFDEAIAGEPYTQDISSFYPSFFGIVQSIGSIKIAVTIININNEILDQDDYFSGIYVFDDNEDLYPGTFNINYNITDNTLLGGISGATFITDYLSIGATVYGLRRRSEQIANQTITYDKTTETTYLISNTYLTDVIYGIIGRFGIQFMPIDVLSFGISTSIGDIFSHKRESQSFLKRESADGDFNSSLITFTRDDESFNDDELPVNIRAGVAFFPNSKLVLSADIIAHIGDKYYRNKVEDTYNGAIGMEYFVTKSFPVRLGFFTNFANTPKINKNQGSQEMHVNMYGMSMSLSWQTKSSAISLAGFYQFGNGEAQIIDGTTQVQDTEITSYSISLTGSAKY